MASLVSIVLRSQLRLLSPIITGASLEQTRRSQDAVGKLGARAIEGSVHFSPLALTHCEASWAVPLKGRVTKAILYLHGGAYNAGWLDYAQGFGGILAQGTGRAVLCLGYRLAPENPFPAALEDALEAYLKALERFAPEDIAFAGESAGGGLCYSLALKLKERGLPLPGKIVAISPWTDLTMSRDVAERQKRDPILDRDSLLAYARMYAPDREPDEPLVSPLYGNLRGLPPSLLIVGTDEILYDDSLLMAQALEKAGCNCVLHAEEGLWHVYVLYGVPEARRAMRMIEDYLADSDADREEVKTA